MLDVQNRVLTRLKQNSTDICTKYTTDTSETPSEFPCVYFNQIGSRETATDMENNENAIESTIEIKVYSNKTQYEARRVAARQADILRELGYQRFYGPEPIPNASTGIHRVVARFRRIICVGEEKYM
jgi:hypothetical protein